LVVQDAVAWKETPRVSMAHRADARLDAPIAAHTWPVLLLNVVEGAWNTSGWGVDSIAEGTGEIGPDQATVGVPAAADCDGAGESDENCAKKAVSEGLKSTNFAFTVTTGFANAMFPAVYTVGEQKAM
jgi:hypothetical protein